MFLPRLERLRTMSWESWKSLLLAWLAYPLLIVALRTVGVGRLHRHLRLKSGEARGHSTDIRASDSIVDEVVLGCQAAAAYSPLRPACLARSMMLLWLLRRKDIECDLRIGVARRNGEFLAHAWIERNGLVLNDRADIAERFAPFRDDIFGDSRDLSLKYEDVTGCTEWDAGHP